jgi:hypothetical protein
MCSGSGDDKYMFGATIIFPWALHVLSQIPAAVMTDSTFDVSKPSVALRFC